MKLNITATVLIFFSAQSVRADATVTLTITNGGSMPVSPAAVYVRNGSNSLARVGTLATPGLIALCQTGNPELRLQELRGDLAVYRAVRTTAPLAPGDQVSIEIPVHSTRGQSVHFESMYGRSTDVCAIASLDSHSLVALQQKVTRTVHVQDRPVVTGAFRYPALPDPTNYLQGAPCDPGSSAVTCLRELSSAIAPRTPIAYFQGYLPSVLGALEMTYGSDATQQLFIPSAGALQISATVR